MDAHVAPCGKSTELFTQAANALSVQRKAPFETDHKALHDRFFLLVSKFEKESMKRAGAAGIEEELTPKEELLQEAAHAMQGHREKTETERKERIMAEQRLIEAGGRVRSLAMELWQDRSANPKSPDSEEADEDTRETEPSPGPSERRGRVRRRQVCDDDDDLLGVLERSDARKRELEERRAALDDRRLRHDI